MTAENQPFVPRRVFVETYMGCGHRCEHCYQTRNGFVRGRHLSVADAVRRVAEMKRLGVAEVVPVTGEVLERPEYLEVYRAAGWTDYLVSNGLRIVGDGELCGRVAGCGFRRLRISAHYGASRFAPYGPDTVPLVVRAAAEHGMEVEAFNVIGTFNYRRIVELFDRAVSDGLVRLWLINLIPTSADLLPFSLTPDQIQEVFRQVGEIRGRDEGNQRRLRLLGNFGPRPDSWLGPRLAAEGRYCPAGRESAYVAVDGSVYGCHFMLEPSRRLGQFVAGRFEMISDALDFDRRTCAVLRKP